MYNLFYFGYKLINLMFLDCLFVFDSHHVHFCPNLDFSIFIVKLKPGFNDGLDVDVDGRIRVG